MRGKLHLTAYTILALFAIFALFPFIWVIFCSLKNTSEIFSGVFFPTTIRILNYPNSWRIAELGQSFINSIVVTFFVIAINLIISSMAGYSFAKLKLRQYPNLFYIYISCLAIPGQATAIALFLQLKSMGLQNNIWGLIIVLAGGGSVFGTFMLRNFFRDISDSYAESAEIDGASIVQVFTKIYIPMAKPAITTLLVFVSMGAWNDYYLSLLLLKDDNLWTIPLAISSIKSLAVTQFGYAFAATVMSFLPIIVIYFIFNQKFIEGIALGGEKA